MPYHPSDRLWRSIQSERELIELAKTKTLEAIAKQFNRSPEAILNKARKLGLSIKRSAKLK
jgi:hypothetical protein